MKGINFFVVFYEVEMCLWWKIVLNILMISNIVEGGRDFRTWFRIPSEPGALFLGTPVAQLYHLSLRLFHLQVLEPEAYHKSVYMSRHFLVMPERGARIVLGSCEPESRHLLVGKLYLLRSSRFECTYTCGVSNFKRCYCGFYYLVRNFGSEGKDYVLDIFEDFILFGIKLGKFVFGNLVGLCF